MSIIKQTTTEQISITTTKNVNEIITNNSSTSIPFLSEDHHLLWLIVFIISVLLCTLLGCLFGYLKGHYVRLAGGQIATVSKQKSSSSSEILHPQKKKTLKGGSLQNKEKLNTLKQKLKFHSPTPPKLGKTTKEAVAAQTLPPPTTKQQPQLLQVKATSAIGKESQLLQTLLKDQKTDNKVAKTNLGLGASLKAAGKEHAKEFASSKVNQAEVVRPTLKASTTTKTETKMLETNAPKDATSPATSFGLGVIRSDDSLALFRFKTARLGSLAESPVLSNDIEKVAQMTAYKTAEDIKSSMIILPSKTTEKHQQLESADSLGSLTFKTATEMS